MGSGGAGGSPGRATTRTTVVGQQRCAIKAAAPPLLPQPDDDVLQSSAALVARGHILPASAEDEAMLRAHLASSIPGAEFVGSFEVLQTARRGIYDALKASIEEQRGADRLPAERDLWHGTSWAIVSKILQHGFNRIFAGRHGTLLGVATYFAADLAYSQRFCDRQGSGKDATKVVLYTRVLVGRYCKGSSTDVEPPLLNAEGGERYDSTVDNEEHPTIFAVFRDFQALPQFLLEFRS